MEGNVALKDGEPFIHAHVVLSDHKMQTLGGHLFETTVGVAGEFFLTQFDGNAYRIKARHWSRMYVLRNEFRIVQ